MAFLTIQSPAAQVNALVPVNTGVVAAVSATGSIGLPATSRGALAIRRRDAGADYRAYRAQRYAEDGEVRRGMLVDDLV